MPPEIVRGNSGHYKFLLTWSCDIRQLIFEADGIRIELRTRQISAEQLITDQSPKILLRLLDLSLKYVDIFGQTLLPDMGQALSLDSVSWFAAKKKLEEYREAFRQADQMNGATRVSGTAPFQLLHGHSTPRRTLCGGNPALFRASPQKLSGML